LNNEYVIKLISTRNSTETVKELQSLRRCPEGMRDNILFGVLHRLNRRYDQLRKNNGKQTGIEAMTSFLQSEFSYPNVLAMKTKDLPAQLKGVGDVQALRHTVYELGSELEATKTEMEVEQGGFQD
jgi:hypothetical protein